MENKTPVEDLSLDHEAELAMAHMDEFDYKGDMFIFAKELMRYMEEVRSRKQIASESIAHPEEDTSSDNTKRI